MWRQELGKDPGSGVSVHDMRTGGQVKGWSPWAPDVGHAVVLMRMGGFRRHASGQDSFLDAAGGYVTSEGLEERFAYPSAGEIRYTWIALTPRTERPGPGAPPTTRVIHRRMALAVQEALSCGHLNDGAEDLARLVGASPKHVGRIFRHVTGRTISEYRNELRVRAVLEHLADGGAQLAELATMYGFADHAHLTRTVRKHLAETPSALRARLDPGGL
ncbi:helix-turn-helix domain-containing protein [Nonomuraea sp. NPDC050227]|uniref:helix-turn-helix domain-containing protein n=1 Tax=Nonomuraea sp. NPDC050227 TaxID=3364360 RepID=UPI003787F3BC